MCKAVGEITINTAAAAITAAEQCAFGLFPYGNIIVRRVVWLDIDVGIVEGVAHWVSLSSQVELSSLQLLTLMLSFTCFCCWITIEFDSKNFTIIKLIEKNQKINGNTIENGKKKTIMKLKKMFHE